MSPRTTTSGRRTRGTHARRPPAGARRPALYLGVAAAGGLAVNLLVGAGPAAQAESGTPRSVSVAQQLGLTAQSVNAPAAPSDLRPLEQITASRSTREAQQTAAQQSQAAADQAEVDRQKAEADAAAQAAAASSSAAAAAASSAAASASAAAAEQAAGTAVTETAHITNSAGPVKAQVQAAADRVVSNVPGTGALTLGGTRASATDPDGHPSGKALDYMVLGDTALGNAIVQYHIDHWDELGVEYIIYKQRILQSPNGSWAAMGDRGSPTANHMDHVHVNYR
jgi:hypothetical protein